METLRVKRDKKQKQLNKGVKTKKNQYARFSKAWKPGSPRYTARTCLGPRVWSSSDTHDVVIARLTVNEAKKGYVQDNILRQVIHSKGMGI